MLNKNISVEPQSLPIGNTSVYVEVSSEQASDNWNVMIVFSRAPNQAPIQGQQVKVQLLDNRGVPLEVLERPSSTLVEVGGSLGTSANALFRFQNTKSTPAQLLVTYQEQTLRFWILSEEKGLIK